MATHTLSTQDTYTHGSGQFKVRQSYTQTAGAVHQIVVDVSQANPDTQVELNIDISQLKAIVMHVNKGATIKTNSSSVPDDTFEFFTAGVLEWFATSPEPNIFTADVTSLYVTNDEDDSPELRLTLVALEDPTV